MVKRAILLVSLLASIFCLHADESEAFVQEEKLIEQSPENNEQLSDVESKEEAEDEEMDLSESTQEPQQEKLILLDKIDAVVAEGDNWQVIATSDIAKRDFDGKQHTLDDIINEDLMDIVATRLKISVDNDDVNKFLQKNKLSKEQIKAIAQANGYYDLTEFYDQFKKMYKANQALSFKMQSELVFPEEEIQAYYQEHPIVQEASYTIEIASVPFDEPGKKEEQKKKLQEFVAGAIHMNLLWETPITLKQQEISAQNDFLFSLQEGQLYLKETENSFDIFKLKKLQQARALPLEERRYDIINALKAERYEKVMEQIFEQLRKTAVILMPTFSQYPVPVYPTDI